MVIRQEQWVTTNRSRTYRFTNSELADLNYQIHRDLVLDRDLTMQDVRDAINDNGNEELDSKDGTGICHLNDYIMDYLSDLMDEDCTDDEWYYFNQDIEYNEFSTVKAEKK